MEKSSSIFEYLIVVPEIKIIYSPNGLKSYKEIQSKSELNNKLFKNFKDGVNSIMTTIEDAQNKINKKNVKALLAPSTHGGDIGHGKLLQGVNMMLAEPAQPDYSTAYSLHDELSF